MWAAGQAWYLGGTAAVVGYSPGSDGGSGDPGSQSVTIEWDNPWTPSTPLEDNRRFEASVSGRRDLVVSVHALDAEDGTRGVNPLELRYTLERMGETRAYSVVEGSDGAAGASAEAEPARMEGFLQKKQPSPGLRWQKRWFVLGVDGTLRYFATAQNKNGDQTQELKNVIHLKNVTAIDEAVGHETEFMIEHIEKPKKRSYHLRAESTKLRTKWLQKLRDN